MTNRDYLKYTNRDIYDAEGKLLKIGDIVVIIITKVLPLM